MFTKKKKTFSQMYKKIDKTKQNQDSSVETFCCLLNWQPSNYGHSFESLHCAHIATFPECKQ